MIKTIIFIHDFFSKVEIKANFIHEPKKKEIISAQK